MAPSPDPTVNDLRRELEKALDALQECLRHLSRHAEMNAALHCSERVMYSPLHAKTEAAVTGIKHALTRTEQHPATSPEHSDANCPWFYLLADFDRCEHGRHQEDPCGGSCGTRSQGNPHMRTGHVIGYNLRREHIVMPHRDDKTDPKAWRQTKAEDA